MNASFSYTWTHEFGNNYSNNRFGTAISNFSFFGSFPSTPERAAPRTSSRTGTSSSAARWTPAGVFASRRSLKMSSGAPYGRYFSVAGCSATVTTNCSNYGTQLVLVEPIGTRRQDNIALLDFRVEKQIAFAQHGKARAVLRHVQRAQREHAR